MNDSNIKKTYDTISTHFSKTRYNIWNCVKLFLDKVEKNTIIGDIGCGNGKNMLYRKDCNNIGCDLSNNLVNICIQKNLNVVLGNILNIPYKNNIFDYTICIAVIHHLSSINKRKQAINELIRVTKKGGKILILVWAFEQEKSSRFNFTKQDNYIDWKDKDKNIIGKRFYHVFKQNELEELIDKSLKYESFYEKGNWCIIISL
jgi:ubiquinone/menaquinone biosynthesis C-methylase UbiE